MLKNSNKAILEEWLTNCNRTLTDDQKDLVLRYATDKTPLYLRLAFEIAKEWKSTDNIENNENELAFTENELVVKFFENVIKKHYIKKELLELTLGLISASKDGLSESELIDILSNEKDILSLYERESSSYPNLQKLPDAIFSKMYYHIQDIFTERFIDDEMLINPYHRIVEEVLKEKYYNSLAEELHTKLEKYFRENSFDIMIQSDDVKLKLKNFMYHLYHLKEYEKLEILLIMFNEIIVEELYNESFGDLISIYNFDSEVPEVKKLQGMKLILDECFVKNDQKLYEKKDYKDIHLDNERLIEYGIKNFNNTFKNMLNQVGIQNFLLSDSQENSIDEIVWLKNYTMEDNYANLYMGLISTDYNTFNMDELIDENNICKECKCLRQDEQLIEGVCKKCLIEDKRYQEIKEWLEKENYYIWEDKYIDLYDSDFGEWQSENQQLARDEFELLNQSLIESEQPPMTWSVYLEVNTSERDYKAAFSFDLHDYITEKLGLEEFDIYETLEEYGFSYE